jgi:hypothetical protein
MPRRQKQSSTLDRAWPGLAPREQPELVDAAGAPAPQLAAAGAAALAGRLAQAKAAPRVALPAKPA